MASGTPKVGRVSPPNDRIIGYRIGFGRFALWTCAELATTPEGVRYLAWMCSQKWLCAGYTHQLIYKEARAALIGALQCEAVRDGPVPEGFV